jgi:dienelactone hydrolase
VIRTLVAAGLFVGGVLALLPVGVSGQPPADKKTEKKQPAGQYDPPKPMKPDDATLKQIAEKTDKLRKAITKLKSWDEEESLQKELKTMDVTESILLEVEIYLKAAENIVRFEEWYAKDSGKWATTTLDRGLERAKQAADGKSPWRDTPGRWVVRAYRSRVDGSIQPYAVLLPHDFGKDPKKKWRLDVVLHSRDASLTEAKFIATHDTSKAAPKELGYIQLEVYGRGNNAYRWAGETDVFEAINAFCGNPLAPNCPVDTGRIVLRGFSMGGAGTWHLGLHNPGMFCVMGPGAGFTTTHGYIGNLPKQLPDYQEKCLHIYDAVDYAENAFNIPVVAYSGEKDPQKAAADNVERLLKGFKEALRFTHLVAPGLQHQMPGEWQQKAEVEYRKYADKGRDLNPKRIRFVTYTPQYGRCGWLDVLALEQTYEKAVVDATRDGTDFTLLTTNIREVGIRDVPMARNMTITIDGQKITARSEGGLCVLAKERGKWINSTSVHFQPGKKLEKKYLTGPIDDAFRSSFTVIKPARPGWHPGTNAHAVAAVEQFTRVWDRYFRGTVPSDPNFPVTPGPNGIVLPTFSGEPRQSNLVLFGDPASNSEIAEALPKLPITWTKDKLVVNGVEYDPKTHLPVLIYPYKERYVVLNSGHTFKEADLKGTNALLYPRLGDWAVIKPTPTANDPAAYEVVAAGLFDGYWQFPKK